jgi:glucosylceramidase
MKTAGAGLTSIVVLSGLTCASLCAQKKGEATLWLTMPDKSALFEQKEFLHFAKAPASNPTIDVDDKQKFQPIDGFGYALTGGSAQHMIRMDAGKRAALIEELFATGGNNIGVSFLRVSIGASDLNDHVFSYDDAARPDGCQHEQVQSRSRSHRCNSRIDEGNSHPESEDAILGSPWSAPPG